MQAMVIRRYGESEVVERGDAESGVSLREDAMRVIVFGAGVIGQIYAGRLAAAGHEVTLLARGHQVPQLRDRGVQLCRDGVTTVQRVPVLDVETLGAAPCSYDALLVCVRRDQLPGALPVLGQLDAGTVVLLQNAGPAPDVAVVPLGTERVVLAFPGVGGFTQADVIHYIQIAQQPTTIDASAPHADRAAALVRSAGLPVRLEPAMPSWLKTHIIFISCLSAGILSREGDAAGLAQDRSELRRVMLAIREGFGALRSAGVRVTPPALRVLFLHLPVWFAAWYWRRALAGPVGVTAIAPHTRATRQTEMPQLCADALVLAAHDARARHLRSLLEPWAQV